MNEFPDFSSTGSAILTWNANRVNCLLQPQTLNSLNCLRVQKMHPSRVAQLAIFKYVHDLHMEKLMSFWR